MPDDATAFSHRETAFEYVGAARWTDPAEDEARMATRERVRLAWSRHASGAYVNAARRRGPGRCATRVFTEKLARLTALKDAFDPDNVFHLNQNIPPSSTRLTAG